MKIVNVNRDSKKVKAIFDLLFKEKIEAFVDMLLKKFDGPFDFGVHFGDVIFGLLTSMEKALNHDEGTLIISFYATFRKYMNDHGIAVEEQKVHKVPMSGNANGMAN